MLLNYLKLSLRLLVRNPFFTFINVAGLSVGFAAFFGLWQYASSELKSDQYHPDADRIARLCTDWKWTDDGTNWGHMVIGSSMSVTTHQISQDFPEVESYLRILHQSDFNETLTGNGREVMLSHEKKDGTSTLFKETKAVYADANLFEFLSMPLLYGEEATVLKYPNSIALSRKAAIRFFGNENPLGEPLVLNGAQSLRVTGVFEDLPNNTHLNFDLVISNVAKLNQWNTYGSFDHFGTHNYIKLKSNSFKQLENKINKKIQTYWAESFRKWQEVRARLIVQPLSEVPFSQNFIAENFRVKSKMTLFIMGSVSVIILFMAWINYINLTVSRTTGRMKEVATRKVSGATSADFVKQFLMEALVINVLAVILAATLLQLLREPASLFLQIHFPSLHSVSWGIIIFFLMAVTIGILITGLYPALMSATYNPRLLFLTNSRPAGKKLLSSILTTGQYAAAVVLIFFGFIIHDQLNYILDKDLGIDKERVFFVDPPVVGAERYAKDVNVYKNEIATQPYVQNVRITKWWLNLSLRRYRNSIHSKSNGIVVSENFIPFYNLRMLAGRNFRLGDRKDVVLLSRRAVERMGFKDLRDAIGGKIYVGDQPREMEIVGVIEDFRLVPFLISTSNTESDAGRGYTLLYDRFEDYVPNIVTVKLSADHLKESLLGLEKSYSQIFPGNAFNGFFFEDWIHEQYEGENIARNQITFFTGLAIGIACLGLLGMITNRIVEKTREIGIRKALGAGIKNVGYVLLGSTVRQVIASVIIGIPVAYSLSQHYLERYSDRIHLQ